jgi:sigma-E factor negative regulatory protein RseC
MITETGRVVAVEPDCLWVETIQQSTCGSCAVKKGCGHSLLNEVGAGRRNHLRVLLNGQLAGHYCINDQVEISIPERVLVQGALVVYLVPLIGLLAGAILVSQWWPGDVAAFIGSVVGFVMGIILVKLHSIVCRDNVQMQPIVLPRNASAIGSSSSVVISTQ